MLEGETVGEGLEDPIFKNKPSCFKKHLITILVALAIVLVGVVILIVILVKGDDDDDDKDKDKDKDKGDDDKYKDPFTILKADVNFTKPNIAFDAKFQIVKASNGMTGLLINDQYAKISKVCFRVENGYLMDTVDGISLLAEHMVYYGSSENYDPYANVKKFKGLKGFENKIYTDRANQGYYYQFNNNYKFEESIKLLADSFRYPKFEEEVIKNTIQIINHEFYDGINDQYFLLEDTIRQLSSKDTSFNGFGCGTNETLKPSESDKLAKK
jgi:secreted Zn-dependent insulinase-like peptidase